MSFLSVMGNKDRRVNINCKYNKDVNQPAKYFCTEAC